MRRHARGRLLATRGGPCCLLSHTYPQVRLNGQIVTEFLTMETMLDDNGGPGWGVPLCATLRARAPPLSPPFRPPPVDLMAPALAAAACSCTSWQAERAPRRMRMAACPLPPLPPDTHRVVRVPPQWAAQCRLRWSAAGRPSPLTSQCRTCMQVSSPRLGPGQLGRAALRGGLPPLRAHAERAASLPVARPGRLRRHRGRCPAPLSSHFGLSAALLLTALLSGPWQLLPPACWTSGAAR